MVSTAGYLRLTRQHLIATPFPPAQQGHAPRTACFICEQLISVTKCVVWGSVGKARKVADLLHMNLAGASSTWMKSNTSNTASREGYSVSGCGSWAWSSPATRLTSHTVMSLFPVVPAQGLLQVKSNHSLNHILTF